MSIVSLALRWCLIGWLVILYAGMVGADDQRFEKIGKAGVIDWVGQRLTATGYGAVSQTTTSPAKSEIVAQRTAVVVARRNLLEVVKGVAIDSRTTIEQSMLKDDRIVATIKGFLSASRIDRTRVLADGSVEATVSISLAGSLGETLNRLAVDSPSGGSSLAARITQLETRVSKLEDQIAAIHHASVESHVMVQLLLEWSAAGAFSRPNAAMVVEAQQTDLPDMADMQRRLALQEDRYAALVQQLKLITKRLTDIETDRQASPRSQAPAPAERLPYTGIVIDARGLGFKPCLKPEIYGNGRRLYPDRYIRPETAIRSGYVRYYRDLTLAQQSKRVGSLPLTIKARDTANGQRSLTIDPAAVDTLQKLAAVSDGVLAECKVVIVF